MQKKSLYVLFGIFFLLLISAANFMMRKETLPPIPEINYKQEPIVEYFENVYLLEMTNQGISFFDGSKKEFAFYHALISGGDSVNVTGGDGNDVSNVVESHTGKIADVTVTNGMVTMVEIHTGEKINDKVVALSKDSYIELEQYGYIPFAKNVKIYQLYGDVMTADWKDIRIGYSFADYVLENGEIIAVLLAGEEVMQNIRVLLKNSDYDSIYHEIVQITCDVDFTVNRSATNIVGTQDSGTVHKAGEIVNLSMEQEGRLIITPNALTGRITVLSINRSQGHPVYRGNLEVIREAEGFVLINEVALDEYLYGVVPSEMPASYPKEALKAQAVCARTYAYAHILNPGIPEYGAHVDDSTSYQVYQNTMERPECIEAINETRGIVLYGEGGLLDTYYYSTSCGFGADERVWNPLKEDYLTYLEPQSISYGQAEWDLRKQETTEKVYTKDSLMEEENFRAFIQNPPPGDFECEEVWYRWQYEVNEVDEELIYKRLKVRYRNNPDYVQRLVKGEFISQSVERPGKIKNIYVEKRGQGGIAYSLIIEGEENTYRVITESNIRYVLCGSESQVVRQDGSTYRAKTLLPSAFFVIDMVGNESVGGNADAGEETVGYRILGGGFGHGAGMSQNAAKNMAQAGYDMQDILSFFYKGCEMKAVGEQ